MDETLNDKAPSQERMRIGEGILVVVFAAVTIIFVIPLVMMLFSAFKPIAEILRKTG